MASVMMVLALFVSVALADLDDDAVRVPEPYGLPSGNERAEIDGAEAHVGRFAHVLEECVHVSGLEGDVPDDAGDFGPGAVGRRARGGRGGGEEFEVDPVLAQEEDLVTAGRHRAGQLEAEPALVEAPGQLRVTAVEADVRPAHQRFLRAMSWSMTVRANRWQWPPVRPVMRSP